MKKTLRSRKGGFTLIELMIVVAIIGILAAIAIPNFLRFQLKSKTSEGKVNLAAIRTAEESYLAEFGIYVAESSQQPNAVPITTKQAWPNPAPVGFDTIGWAPEGNVYFVYSVNVQAGPPQQYTATADADLDGDGVLQGWAYAQAPAGGAPIAGVGVCAAPPVANQVGPCQATFGNSIF